MKFKIFHFATIGAAIGVLTFIWFLISYLFHIQSQEAFPRRNAEALIDLGIIPSKRMTVTFDFPSVSESEVNLLRKKIKPSIIPEGTGYFRLYEPGDIYPDGENHSYSILEVSTEKVRPHTLRIEFLEPEKWPEKVIISVYDDGL